MVTERPNEGGYHCLHLLSCNNCNRPPPPPCPTRAHARETRRTYLHMHAHAHAHVTRARAAMKSFAPLAVFAVQKLRPAPGQSPADTPASLHFLFFVPAGLPRFFTPAAFGAVAADLTLDRGGGGGGGKGGREHRRRGWREENGREGGIECGVCVGVWV